MQSKSSQTGSKRASDVWKTCQHLVGSPQTIDRLSEFVRLQVTLDKAYPSSMLEAESHNHSCSKPNANMKAYPANTLLVTYALVYFDPADAGRVEQQLDQAFDALFEAMLADKRVIEESTDAPSRCP